MNHGRRSFAGVSGTIVLADRVGRCQVIIVSRPLTAATGLADRYNPTGAKRSGPYRWI
jgi:hypothetical protein